MSRPAVHQFHAGTAPGDGVTNAMLFTQRLLRELGFESGIFAANVARELAGRIQPITAYPDRPGDVLLLHHSMGHAHGDWVTGLQSRRVLVYHNITPPDLLPAQGPWRREAERGREQLRAWRDGFAASVAVSPYNARDLEAEGYNAPYVLPLLVDLDHLRDIEPDPDALAARRLNPTFSVLFAGRMVPHKRQALLLEALARLRDICDRPVRLVLAGHQPDWDYSAALKQRAQDLGVADAVEALGCVSAERLAAEFAGCDAYCSLSAHEGFGMPLIEAMAADLPVVTSATGNVADTLGEGGLLLSEADPAAAAGALKLIAEEPNLRRRVLQGQRRNLTRFERPTILAGLRRLLLDLGLSPTEPSMAPPMPVKAFDDTLDSRVEGPFDSSYSLARVNRELAAALHRQGARVGLHATEGHGDYPADPGFLRRHPQAAQLHAAGQASHRAEAVLRNCFPPRTDNMPGLTKVIANFAWEESGFPREQVAAFNRDLNLITVTSRYVAKVLRDNGVRTPIAVAGNGVDHLRDITPKGPNINLGDAAFTFLHVSSCFPRKGVDVLLEAWGQTFTAADDVALVIKTFPNPHNTVRAAVKGLPARYPDHAPVIVVERDLDEAELAGLYRAANAFVAPSRGEGFGLPLAEAALFDLPVITTAHGGQRDFCTPETAWPVDYRLARAATHLALPNSVWAEPDLADLGAQLRNVRTANPEAKRARTAALRRFLEATYTWDAVARRTQAARAALDDLPAVDLPPRTAWVTSWNSRCGIAAYARYLSCRFPASHMTVLANHCGDDRLYPDGDNVVRCWTQGQSDDLTALQDAILDSRAGAVVLQFNFGFFHLDAFGRLLYDLHAKGLQTYVVLHATADVEKPGRRLSLNRIPAALAGATRLFVHGVADLNRLKAFGHTRNVTLLPHGVGRKPDLDADDLRARYGLGAGPFLASFGYLLPHKGLRELVETFEILRDSRPDLRLVMLHALYPAPESETEHRALSARIAESRHREGILLIDAYLPDETALGLLSLADTVVFPYQHTQESASGAVRFGMASERPVACTPLPIFDDVAEASHRLPGTTPADMAEGLAALLDDEARRERLETAQKQWLAARRWEVVSDRLWNILMAEARDWRADWLTAPVPAADAQTAEAVS